jgi:hypothetical protein
VQFGARGQAAGGGVDDEGDALRAGHG